MTATAPSLFHVKWHRAPFLAFDTETTGVDVWNDRIVTATLALIDGPNVHTTTWLINPGIDIPQAATDVHGITTEQAQAEGRDPAEAIREITEIINDACTGKTPVVAFNAAFDFTILRSEAARHAGKGFEMPNVIDPFVIDKHIDPYRKGKRTLTAVCEHHGVTQTDAHDATGDALAAARLAWALTERHPDLLQTDPAELHQAQTGWRRDQAESFARYLVRQGRPDDVARGWPIQERR